MGKGFSNVELIIVGSVLGMLAMVAGPSYLGTRAGNEANELAEEFRTYAAAFRIYQTSEGTWPPDALPGTIPQGMENRLSRFNDETFSGGHWDWDCDATTQAASLSLVGCRAGKGVFERIDQILDDGDLATGSLLASGNRLTLLLE